MKFFISMPMRGLSDELIAKIMSATCKAIKRRWNGGEWINTLISDPDINEPLEYLGESIKRMAKADIVFFVTLVFEDHYVSWMSARGCQIENLAANSYGKQTCCLVVHQIDKDKFEISL